MALDISTIGEIKHILDLAHHLSDAKKYDSMDQVFTQDAVYDLSYRGLEPAHGLAAIVALKKLSSVRDRSDVVSHHLSNTVVTEEADGIHARSKIIVVLVDGKVRSSEYDDVMEKTAKGWRIKRRTPNTPISQRLK